MKPWNQTDIEAWLKDQTIKRSYQDEVVTKILALKNQFDIIEYGSLSYSALRYPLFLIKTKNFDKNKKTILITGGVHGYETSGVHGALAFFEREVVKFDDMFNFICAPCVSPWAYETINRWNAKALDPNRCFYSNGPSEECSLFLEAVSSVHDQLFAHFDLHETTDTDNSIFRPALEKRDAVKQEIWEIPDGFYIVGDTANPQPGFQKAVIAAVKKVTHIAPGDKNGMIIGVPLEQEGVINYNFKKLFLCAGLSNSEYTTTTEVYPDSPKVTDALCVDAQVAAVRGGVEYLKNIQAD